MSVSKRTGIWIFVLLLVTGLLVGAVLTEKGYAAPPAVVAVSVDDQTVVSARIAECDEANPCRTAWVKRARRGVKKYKAGKVGKAIGFKYPRKAKRIILRKLMRKQEAMNATSARPVLGRVLTRRQMWRKYTRQDTCFYRVSVGYPNTAYWSCDDPKNFPDDKADWSRKDVRAVICAGMLGIGIGGAMATGAATGPGAPWVWAGLGAGWAACQWQSALERMAD